MSKVYYLLALGAGTAAAIYFYDEKKGKKRRARFRRNVEEGWKRADEYTKEWRKQAPKLARQYGTVAGEVLRNTGKRAGELSRDYGSRAGVYLKDAGSKAHELAHARNGHNALGSARFLGAMASTIAIYGTARRGFLGTFLRTLSLGLFTKALMAAR
jgi:hypothetical protein